MRNKELQLDLEGYKLGPRTGVTIYDLTDDEMDLLIDAGINYVNHQEVQIKNSRVQQIFNHMTRPIL